MHLDASHKVEDLVVRDGLVGNHDGQGAHPPRARRSKWRPSWGQQSCEEYESEQRQRGGGEHELHWGDGKRESHGRRAVAACW